LPAKQPPAEQTPSDMFYFSLISSAISKGFF